MTVSFPHSRHRAQEPLSSYERWDISPCVQSTQLKVGRVLSEREFQDAFFYKEHILADILRQVGIQNLKESNLTLFALLKVILFGDALPDHIDILSLPEIRDTFSQSGNTYRMFRSLLSAKQDELIPLLKRIYPRENIARLFYDILRVDIPTS